MSGGDRPPADHRRAVPRTLASRAVAALVPVGLIAALIAYAWPALGSYNVTWDEALGDLFFGQRYLSFWTGFDPDYLDFAADPYPSDHRPDLRASAFRTRPWEHYPLGATLGALTSEVLWRGLGLLDPYDGYHAANLALAAVLIAVLVPFLRRRFGTFESVVATVLLFAMPRVFAHLMANIKDFPLMVVFTVAAVAFLTAYERGSLRGLLAAGALWGAAMATKANGLFLPAIPAALVAIDLIRGRLPDAWRDRGRRLALAGAGYAAIGLTTLIALWPYLWADPIGRLGKNLAFVLTRRATTRPESMAPVLEAITLTTPLPLLVLAAIGLMPAIALARRGNRAAVLVLVWIPAVLARYLVPSAVNYDGVRHFLELFPALAVLAALGAGMLARGLTRLAARVSPAIRPALVRWLLAVLLLVPATTTLIAAHPFELAYWNRLAGGLSGARAAGRPQAGDYWGASYRLGLDWLNANAEANSLLAVPVIEHAVRLVAPERLRPDITLLPTTTPFSPRIAPERLAGLHDLARERPVFVMFVDRRDWRNALMAHLDAHGMPHAAWAVDGVPVLRIYRLDRAPSSEARR